MKIKQLSETTAGAVASVAMPLGKTHKRTEEAANPAQQAAIAVNMKKDGKKPKNVKEGFSKDEITAAVKDYIKQGGEVVQGKKSKGPRKPGLSLASKHIGGGGDKMRPSRTGRGSNPLGKAIVAVEDESNYVEINPKSFLDDDFYAFDPETKVLKGTWSHKSVGRRHHEYEAQQKGYEVVSGMKAKHLGLVRKQKQVDEGGFDIPEIPRAPTPKPPADKNVKEGMFGLDEKTKAKIQNIAVEISDIPGYWDWERDTFTPYGILALEEALGDKKYVKYALSLTADDDYELEEDWQKVNRKDKTSGMSSKAVKAYRRENPGSKLKTAVTTKPSKLKRGSKAAKRRKSFCARMSGNKGPMKKPNGKPTPKALALRRWNCESIEDMRNLIENAERMIAEEKKRLDPKCWTGYKKQGTKMKGGVRVNNCVPVEETKPGLYANVNAKRERIKHGSGERMRKPGTKGAPSAQAWRDAAKTAKTESNIMRGMLEAALSEEEILLAPGQGIKYRTELMPKRTDHEVEMARNQLRSSFENAKDIYQSIKDLSEIQGLDGWVQAKITKASDYLEAVNQYLEGKKQMIEKEVEVAEETMTADAEETNQTFGPGGMSRTIGSSGDITTRSDIGGTSVSQTKTPGGYIKQTTAGMDMGNAGSASMVQQAPQQPGQLAGTTTVTRTAAAGPKYDADAGIAANTPSAQPVTGSAVRGVAFGGASGANVGNNVVTTGNTALAQQAKRLMPGSNKQQGLGEDEIEDRLTAQYNTPQMKAQSQRVDQAFASGDQAEFDRMGILSPQQIEKDYQDMLAREPAQDAALMRNPKLTPSARPAQRYNPKGVPIRETEKLSTREKFKRGLKRAGYDPDAGADRLLRLIARQAEERKDFERKQKEQDEEFYKNRIKENEPAQPDNQQEQPKSNKLFDVLKGIGDIALPVGRAIYGMQGRDIPADLKSDVKTMIRNKVTGEPNK
jgi:hypothetical protein